MIRTLPLLLMLISSTWGLTPAPRVEKRPHHHGASAPAFSTLPPSLRLQASQQNVNEMVKSTITQEFTLKFPSYQELMLLSPGDYVASDPMHVVDDSTNTTHDFCLLLYPRGGGHSSKTNNPLQSDSGFGMSYKIFGDKSEKVGLYLKYLGEDSVDATFSLLLKGKQSSGPKFDVEWSSGMRFVSLEESNLSQGMANDFGAHVMLTSLLPEFLGVDVNGKDTSVEAKVSITIHPRISENNNEMANSDTCLSKIFDYRKTIQINMIQNKFE